MSFVCWDRSRLHQILDPDALQMQDAYFLATHVRRMLRQVDPRNPKNELGIVSPEEILQILLAPDVRHRQAAVIGTSGAGKSRLIRWLAVHIPETPERRVVLIQKVGTNLRGVLESILYGLEGPVFDAYRDRLQKAVAGLNVRTAPDEILNQLQQSVGSGSSLSDENLLDEEAREIREILIEELPALLGDPQFRKALRGKSRIVEELVHHAIGRDEGERERRDTRRAFREEDLAVQQWDITEGDVNKLGRKMFRYLRSNARWRRDAADWMNRNLDDALGRLLSFSREDLGLMLRDVRRTLAEQGRELVLLIEDFAKLQGVDYALLDAISVRPDNQEGGPLCRLRSIMAMTTGYYDRIEQTLSGRMDFVVDVDLSDGQDQDRDLITIAARHLNALRTRDIVVQEWSTAATEAARGGSSLPLLPSACEGCDLKPSCHASFGAMETADGDYVGLYPFTAAALREMYTRTKTDGPFNARVLLARVLRQPLVNYTDDLEHGAWPPTAMVRDLGGRQIAPIRYNQLERDLGPDLAGRYDALFELYGDAQTLSGVPDRVFDAFELRPYGDSPTTLVEALIILPETTDLAPPGANAPVSLVPQRVQNMLNGLERWKNGEKLYQDMVNELRKLLFPLVKEAIPWNDAFLGESFHSERNGRSFQQTSLNFEDQAVGLGNAPLTVVIPRTAVLGLQGSILFDLHKNWEFEDGGTYLVEFADMLQLLSEQVIENIRRQNGKSIWDPAPAAAELLLLNCLFCGTLSSEFIAGRRSEGVLLDLILSPESPPPSGLRAVLSDLAMRIYKEQPRLREILMAQVACVKGPTTDKASMIDASRLRSAIQQMARTWRPRAAIPTVILRDYKILGELRERVDRALLALLADEAKIVQEELEKLNSHLGSEVSSHQVKEAVRRASERAREVGSWRGAGGHDDFVRAVDGVRATKLDPLRQKADEEKIGDPRAVPLLFSSELRREIAAGARFVEEADVFLKRTTDLVEQNIAALGGDPDADQQAIDGICNGLAEITASLALLARDAQPPGEALME